MSREPFESCGAIWLRQITPTAQRWICVRCKQWSCEHCGARRRRRVIAELRSGDPTTFMTLTVNPNFHDDASTRATLMIDAFNRLMKRIRRKWPKQAVEYYAVTERTKKGEAHLHVAMRAPFIPQQWLSDTWRELTEAFIVDIRRIKNPVEAANYLAKYIGKKPTQFGRHKRYWRSKKYRLRVQPKIVDPRWVGCEIERLRIDQTRVIWWLKDAQWVIEEASEGYIVASARASPVASGGRPVM